MAHFWMQSVSGGPGAAAGDPPDGWAASRLDPAAIFRIMTQPLRIVQAEPGDRAAGYLELHCADPAGRPGWLLLAPPGIRVLVNGRRLDTGIRLLRDRDELVIDGRPLYFSTEERPAVVPFPFPVPVPGVEIRPAPSCVRCKGPIEPETPAVRCPGCGSWHHQNEAAGRACWSFAERCGLCAQPTAFEQDCRWSPADL